MGEVSGQTIRRMILEQSKRSRTGHIGSCLSIAEIVAALYDGVLNVPSPDDPERDRLVLSKGHAALTLYAALTLRGWIDDATFQTYYADDTMLGVHPEHVLTGVDFSTGSLGHGLSIGAGAALAARLQASARRVFVVMSDAECNEGSIWEAASFAAHHQLSNLVAILDLNGQQALGFTDEVVKMSPMGARWEAFGWRVSEVDGHDQDAIKAALTALDTSTRGAPHMLIAHTVSGKGVGYMERTIEWHYRSMNDEQYAEAMRDIEETS